jgi:ribosomal protein S18 acetylase RimI-like enzyme
LTPAVDTMPGSDTSISSRIRLLVPDDAVAYRALRLRALREHPDAFTSSFEEEDVRPPGWSETRLRPDPARPHDFFLGAFVQGVLVGMVGLQGRYRAKERHNASVVGMFVAPEAGGLGLGRALMQELLGRARALPALEQLDLTVTQGNDRAQALYAHWGFTVFGVLPNAIQVDGRPFAKIHMVLPLR